MTVPSKNKPNIDSKTYKVRRRAMITDEGGAEKECGGEAWSVLEELVKLC